MKILIADSFPQAHLAKLAEAGHRCSFDPSLSGDALAAAIADHEVLIVRSTGVDATVIDAGSALKLVIRAGAGTNSIDKPHAASKGVRVCNVPGANSIAVAELTMGLIIAIDRQIVSNCLDLREGQWNKKKYSKARGLFGQRLGILGLGAIGLAVAQRAHAFGMQVCTIAKPTRTGLILNGIRDWHITEMDSRDELLGQCDIISIHLPFTPETDVMVNHEFLARMKDGAVLINTSRGNLVDEDALIEAMDSKGIRAGLDVYRNEPGSGEGVFSSKLAAHPNVYGTHHIGASTGQAQDAVADGVIRVLASFEAGDLLYCVND